MKLLIKQAEGSKKGELIRAGNYALFKLSAKENDSATIKYLIDNVHDPQKSTMIALDNYSVICTAAKNGNLNIIKSIVKESTSEEKFRMFSADNYAAFRIATNFGHVEVMKYIAEQASFRERQSMLVANDNEVYRYANKKGNPEVLDCLNMIANMPDNTIQRTTEPTQLRSSANIMVQLSQNPHAENKKEIEIKNSPDIFFDISNPDSKNLFLKKLQNKLENAIMEMLKIAVEEDNIGPHSIEDKSKIITRIYAAKSVDDLLLYLEGRQGTNVQPLQNEVYSYFKGFVGDSTWLADCDVKPIWASAEQQVIDDIRKSKLSASNDSGQEIHMVPKR
jgi:hypothetical protein